MNKLFEIVQELFNLFPTHVKQKFILSLMVGCFVGLLFANHLGSLLIVLGLFFYDLNNSVQVSIDDWREYNTFDSVVKCLTKLFTFFLIVFSGIILCLYLDESFTQDHIEDLFSGISSKFFSANNKHLNFALLYGLITFLMTGAIEFLRKFRVKSEENY
jgi:hypothetical protein